MEGGGKDYVESIGGVDISKVRYINNGVDVEEFNHNKENNIYKDKDLDNNNTFKYFIQVLWGHLMV